MKSRLGITLLAVYLLIVGIMGAFGVSLGGLSLLVPILAIVTGVTLLMGK
jgi:hypothetical protein